MSERARPVSRRTAVGLGITGTLAASGVLTGCRLDPPAADPAPGADEEPEPDADVLLVGSVLDSLDGTAALVAAVLTRHPGLSPDLQPLLDVHAAHRAVLDEAAEVEQDTADVPTVPGRPALALDRVRRAENRLSTTLRAATGTAQSGDLARALASMSASVTQHLVVLEDREPVA